MENPASQGGEDGLEDTPEEPSTESPVATNAEDGGFFDVQVCGVNYSNRNPGGAARKEPEHSGDIERAVDGEPWQRVC